MSCLNWCNDGTGCPLCHLPATCGAPSFLLPHSLTACPLTSSVPCLSLLQLWTEPSSTLSVTLETVDQDARQTACRWVFSGVHSRSASVCRRVWLGTLAAVGGKTEMHSRYKSWRLQQKPPPQHRQPTLSSCSESDLFIHRETGMLGIIENTKACKGMI